MIMLMAFKIKNIAIIMLVMIFLNQDLLKGQAAMPEILDNGTLQEQLDYLEGRTRIYNDFRAIREDMFQKVKNNSLDSLAESNRVIDELTAGINNRDADIDSLSAHLANTREELSVAIRNRDSIAFLGIPMSKTSYNLMVWVIIAGLATL